MRILVTGGAGFIGSHLLGYLLGENNHIVVVDNGMSGDLNYLSGFGVKVWEKDIRDEAIIKQIVAEKFDAIVHLAAQTMVDTSIKKPVFDASENIMGTLNILEAAKTCRARVVFASTAAAYGDVVESKLPVLETHPLNPQSFYGLTKVGVEKYLALYHKHYGLDYVVCRFANVYGERQGDKGEGGVISIFAKRIVAGQAIEIYGDGKQTRDFIYAGDVARGICRAMTTKNVNTAYNLSTQTETNLLELVEIMSEFSGRKIAFHFNAARSGDIYRSMLSNQMAREYLGWVPEVSLREGVNRTMNYFKNKEK